MFWISDVLLDLAIIVLEQIFETISSSSSVFFVQTLIWKIWSLLTRKWKIHAISRIHGQESTTLMRGLA